MSLSAVHREVLDLWRGAWPQAIADWSHYVQLHEPEWCFTKEQERQAGLHGSFAMIRLVDHTVVISLRQVIELGLQRFAPEILAHEVGHHVYCPADLTDNARILARMRLGLPGCESYAPMVANLFADLLINDHLNRSCRRNMVGVYQAIQNSEVDSRLWLMYLRIYELLWGLSGKSLTGKAIDERCNQDALLASRLVRSYARDWLGGASRFACLVFPYVSEELEKARQACSLWADTVQAGVGGLPEGLAELDPLEEEAVIHPAEDPFLCGLDPIELDEMDASASGGRVRGIDSGRKSIKSYRSPSDYAEILKASGAVLGEREIAVKYYRERALPHMIPFPTRILTIAQDPVPEGLDLWEPTGDIESIDWIGSLTASPTVIPGVTTRQRLYGESSGTQPTRMPLDLYLGVDCSGSMSDPAHTLSYPVLAGAVMALSALRAGASVKVVLSGEPGRSIETEGFLRDQNLVLRMLVNYLGTGYSFGVHRLQETFHGASQFQRPVHILILSDYDMFAMLAEKRNQQSGWEVARQAVLEAGGGATYLLQLPGLANQQSRFQAQLSQMLQDGWAVALVNSMEELVAFAREFSRKQYARVK
jgi:hypothetical protein